MTASDSASKTGKEEKKRIDIYRDTPIRLLGYANEVGESFRSLWHVNYVRLSYVVSVSYVLADTLDKSKKTYRKFIDGDPELRRKRVARTAVDTVVWQMFASVIVPGFTINRLCYFSNKLLVKTTSLPTTMRKWTTTAIGLGAIPFIVWPIDHAVEFTMDKTLRQLYDTDESK